VSAFAGSLPWPRLATAGQSAWRRVRGDAWPIAQGAGAAAVAWMLATHVVRHHQPFFAPIAAVISLNTVLGERGVNALRLLLGVLVGIGSGELAVAVLGRAYGAMAVATFVAMLAARALGGARIVLAQAAASAILTVAVTNGEEGINRLEDALLGAGVALMFSQVLFAPDPIRLVRRAEAAALEGVAGGLSLSAEALERDDDGLAAAALDRLRDVRDHMTELARTRQASERIVRHALVWRFRAPPVVRENENAGHLDLLGGSALMLARVGWSADTPGKRWLAPMVRELSIALADMAQDPGDSRARQRSVERLQRTTLSAEAWDEPGDPHLAWMLMIVQMVATDAMKFAGVDRMVATSRGQGSPEESPFREG
jgi:hypothetical protein